MASIERWIAETTPTASEFSFPRGLPMAATGSPTATAFDSPSGTGVRLCCDEASRRRPTSSQRSQPRPQQLEDFKRFVLLREPNPERLALRAPGGPGDLCIERAYAHI